MLQVRRADDRGIGRLDWLEARFTFSFGAYQDPAQTGFSSLRLLNDDLVAPGAGFATHDHHDTEVCSYILSGELAHRDSMGEGSVVRAGDVLVMSAGTGITHSEFNASSTAPVRFLQIWMTPSRLGATPRYDQRHFPAEQKRGRLCPLLSPDAADGALLWLADARVYAGLFDGDEEAALRFSEPRYAYVHVVRGSVEVNGTRLSEGDGARLRGEPSVRLAGGTTAEVLLFDLPARETPATGEA
ncbi:MAG: pirin family protein [Vicinamibacterales bacterium]